VVLQQYDSHKYRHLFYCISLIRLFAYQLASLLIEYCSNIRMLYINGIMHYYLMYRCYECPHLFIVTNMELDSFLVIRNHESYVIKSHLSVGH
jgi:hypothetical protein